MFFFTKFLFTLPFLLLHWIGEPFRFGEESALYRKTEQQVKEAYNDAWMKHFVERIFVTAVSVIALIFIGLGVYASSGTLLYGIPIILFVSLAIDFVLLMSRITYEAVETEHIAQNNQIVPQGYFKDTSLKAVLKKRKEDIDAEIAKYPERTGGRAYPHGIETAYRDGM